jgi:hypothetical protein
MSIHIRILPPIALGMLFLVASAASAQHPAMPPGMSHEEHLKQLQKEAEVKERGAVAMGFDQDATTHHFVLTKEGGRIEVTVKDPSDRANLTAIRAHVAQIANAFANGDFGAPLATHGEEPPGVAEMRTLRGSIRYQYDDAPNGGRLVIATASANGQAAIHAFLQYQIREHATGDPLTVGK